MKTTQDQLLITHGTLATFGERHEVIEDGALLIRGNEIAAIGPSAALEGSYPDAERLDAAGRLVMPGSICAHTHFYGAFARGLAIPGAPPENFPQILEKLWWRLDKALLWEDVRLSALVCLMDAIRHGTTTLIDHHASPHAIDGSLDVIAEAVQEAGLRACLCYEVTDRDGPEKMAAGIQENVRFINKVSGFRFQVPGLETGQPEALRAEPFTAFRAGSQGEALNMGPETRIAGTFGLHASLTLSEETLARCVEAAAPLGVGFHIHVAEDKADQQDSLRRSGLRVVERLQRAGILGPRTIAAHCVHIDAYEKDILRETGTLVVHNPRSNMNNAVGVADVEGMLRRGVTVGLGNDGFSNNMFAEMKAAYLVHKLHRGDPRAMPGDVVMQLAYANNAQIAARFFPRPLGELAVGAYADVIILDYRPFTPLSAGNLPWHILFGVEGSEVTHTICGGRLLMKERELLTLDEEAIAARALERAQQVWKRF
ncbi:MAG: putative aminohydrolase SsnA [Anaerolineae bacterium]|nr:putative aminohydrolase SsnA [Anaerolineae bacterium]